MVRSHRLANVWSNHLILRHVQCIGSDGIVEWSGRLTAVFIGGLYCLCCIPPNAWIPLATFSGMI